MPNWCPNCGREVEDREKFCRQCGMNLNLSGEEASTWILSQPTSPNLEPPRPTKQVGQGATSANAQTGPAYVPPVNYYPAPQPRQYQPPATNSSISLGDWLSGGWQIYKENWLLMSVASFIAMILGASTLGIMAGPLLMGLYGMAFKTMRGERPQMSDLFDFKGRFLQAFLVALIFFLIHAGVTGASRGGPLSGIFGFIITPLLMVTLSLTI
ncbi:MAG TPA: zinc ribbon domain-containing protein, partial [Blastocatellia bacterium]|nr:zinc ribbon domain-containing protein [Blastocatellia bacterium]